MRNCLMIMINFMAGIQENKKKYNNYIKIKQIRSFQFRKNRIDSL